MNARGSAFIFIQSMPCVSESRSCRSCSSVKLNCRTMLRQKPWRFPPPGLPTRGVAGLDSVRFGVATATLLSSPPQSESSELVLLLLLLLLLVLVRFSAVADCGSVRSQSRAASGPSTASVKQRVARKSACPGVADAIDGRVAMSSRASHALSATHSVV